MKDDKDTAIIELARVLTEQRESPAPESGFLPGTQEAPVVSPDPVIFQSGDSWDADLPSGTYAYKGTGSVWYTHVHVQHIDVDPYQHEGPWVLLESS